MRLPVRALGHIEALRCEQAARDSLTLDGLDAALEGELAQRHALELAVLDPVALRAGRTSPLFTRSELAELPGQAVGKLLDGLGRASLLASPDVDAVELHAALVAQARSLRAEQLRAQALSIADFFDVPAERLTLWQHFYFAACREDR